MNALLDDSTRDTVLQEAAQTITNGLAANQDVVVYTSRQLISAATAAEPGHWAARLRWAGGIGGID
ncbi:MAG: hypothetical protein R2911_24555 [Caldilineaceae bacterium]